tara:strand:- start:6 stop:260 length:255 start_codon:yes stop_codon:yes gene_type:complete
MKIKINSISYEIRNKLSVIDEKIVYDKIKKEKVTEKVDKILIGKPNKLTKKMEFTESKLNEEIDIDDGKFYYVVHRKIIKIEDI